MPEALSLSFSTIGQKGQRNMIKNKELSHNANYDVKTFTLKELPNYLILDKNDNISYATNITDAVKIATNLNNANESCKIFELIRTQKGFWEYKFDIMKEVL